MNLYVDAGAPCTRQTKRFEFGEADRQSRSESSVLVIFVIQSFVGVELRLDQTSCNFSSKWNCVAAEKIMFNFCDTKLNLIVWTTPVVNLINALL